MLNKIIAAAMGAVLLVSTGLTVYAEEPSGAGTETVSAAEEGAAIRQSMEIKVRDIIYYGDYIQMHDSDGNAIYVNPGVNIYIIGFDDEAQNFYTLLSEGNYTGYLRLSYETAKDFELMRFFITHEGVVIGDLNFNGVVDIYDLCLMRRGLISGWRSSLEAVLADLDGDSQLTVTDLIRMQRWLVGITES